jgi:protein-L-isoaspartate(D-aspartate) O-methyltransferase
MVFGQEKNMRYEIARKNMVWGQLQPNHIFAENILKAFTTVKRELFVPPAYMAICYNDLEIPLNSKRHLLPPMVLARLLQGLGIQLHDKVLVVGATAYTIALLEFFTNKIYAIESDPDALLQLQEYDFKIKLSNQPLTMGWVEYSPFDVILIEGGIGNIPITLINQLSYQGRIGFIETKQEKFYMGKGKVLLKKENLMLIDQFNASVSTVDEFFPQSEFCF